MRTPKFFANWIEDPPPRFVFELSGAGIAVARPGNPPEIGFEPLDPDVIAVSPVHDNVLRMDELTACVEAIAGGKDRKRGRAVLILPDYSVRVSVLDFDAFPSDAGQQLGLVRFRIKKTVPFDLESASIGYYAQPHLGNAKARDVVAAAAPIEVLARYEAPFRAAGLEPGLVTTSSLCALELLKQESGISVMVKLSGLSMVVAVLDRGVLKLLRTIELTTADAAEIASHLYPTFAYIEDQLAAKAGRVFVSGFGPSLEPLRAALDHEDPELEPLRSQFGMPGQNNAGLLGYLESMQEFGR
jgi:type IV pilus assembly protein PilM